MTFVDQMLSKQDVPARSVPRRNKPSSDHGLKPSITTSKAEHSLLATVLVTAVCIGWISIALLNYLEHDGRISEVQEKSIRLAIWVILFAFVLPSSFRLFSIAQARWCVSLAVFFVVCKLSIDLSRELPGLADVAFVGRNAESSRVIRSLSVAGAACTTVFVLHIMLSGYERSKRLLQESETLYRTIVNSEPECVKLVDRDGGLLEMNPAGLEIIEAESVDDVCGRSVYDLVAAEDRQSFQAMNAKIFNGESATMEFDVVGLRGTRLTMETHAAPLYDLAGRVRAQLAVTRNVTDRKRHEKELRDSEERYRTVVSAAGNSIVCLDPEHRITEWNRAAEHLFGVCRDEAIGKNYLEMFIPEEHREGIVADMRRVLDGAATDGYTNPIRRSDGSHKIVSWSVTRMRDSSDQATGVIAVGSDITHRLNIERSLRDSEQRYRSVVESSHDAILGLTNDARIQMWNSAAERMFGYTSSEMIGVSVLRLLTPDRHEEWRDLFSQVREGQSVVETETHGITKDGGQLDIVFSIKPIVEVDGSISGASASIHDVTDLNEQETRLRVQQQTLNHASRLCLMGEMVAGIAHEINQPLSAIANFAGACTNTLATCEHESADSVRELTKRISEQAVRCGDIIRRLRSFVKKNDPARTSVVLKDIIDESVALCRTETQLRSISLECELGGPHTRLHVNPVEIQQVLVNLLQNACEAVSRNQLTERRICVRSRLSADHVEISVEDSGPGIDQQSLGKVFDAFFTTKSHGLGLGLSISKSIIEEYGGRICAESLKPSGAAFRFDLPLSQRGESHV